MSLQVWLPLTKDLRQQGLNGATVTNNGAVYSSTSGKLGGCYNFTNQNIVVPSTSFKSEFTNNQASLAAWVKVTTSHSAYAQALVLGTQGTSWNNILFGINVNGSGTLIANASTGSAYTNLSFGAAIKDGVWHHIVYTYNVGTMKVYLDGVQKATTTTSNTPAWTSSTNLYIGGNSGGEKFQNGDSMNDVRLYNHCLSPMEVKELAKGLVLHYPLNRGGWGQENLLLNTQVLTPNSSTTTKNCSLRGAAARQLRTDGFYEAKCTSSWQGLSTWANAQNLVVGQKYTYSFYFYTDGSSKALSFYPMMFNSSGTRDTSSTLPISVDGSSYQSANARTFGNFSNSTPTKHYVTFEWNNTMASIISNGGTIELSIQVHGTFNSGEYGCVYAPKLELGEIVTPWCPNFSDALATTMGLNGTTEYDCSGYCNNLNKNGTYSYTSDTPKYAVSTVFNGTEWMNGTTPGAEILTLACWAKTTKNKSTSQFMVADSTSGLCISFYSGTIISYFGSGSQSTGSKCTLGSAYKENDWNHFVVVKTGAGTRTVYCNGVEQTATSNDYWGSAAGLFIGSRNNSATLPFYGELSDVRAYATALSASDVKSLYQNCATIDPDGTIRGQIRS